MAVEWIAFHLTDRCQLDCQHCLRDPEKKPKDLSLELIKKGLSEGRRIYNAEHTAFTGGEPTLHPQFREAVDVAIDLGFTWHMVTNGRNLPWLLELFRERPLRRERMTSISFSLDGADEAMHDSIRGAGSYREVMTAISLCAALDIPFVLNTTLQARNAPQIEAFGLLAGQLGAVRLSFVQMQPTGTAHDEGFYLSAAEWRGVMDRIDRLALALKLPVSVTEGFHKPQPFYTCTPFTGQQLHIDVEGNLNLCCQHAGIPSEGGLSDIAGNLRDMSLPEAHQKLLGIMHQSQVDRVAEMARGGLDDEWDKFPCNNCLKRFGKPHWVEGGVGGPAATRARWRGAWSPKKLPIVAG
jgi:MoaA/NifB/PqqE/SkfB family radical SAM enzyme